ncbi:MAG: ribosome assembly cofactor RimP [Spirochaetia bacterium]|nr:ribosome assembly cofactor RimP [Spirochaetia bacterium]
MKIIEKKDENYDLVAPVVEASGFKLVEVNSRQLHEGLHIHIVLYSPEGISINDCSKIHKAIKRRIEAYIDDRDFFIEVSSPGISRNLKSADEFSVFKGKKVKILINNSDDWTIYSISETDDKSVTLESEDGVLTEFKYEEIRKAKLDY